MKIFFVLLALLFLQGQAEAEQIFLLYGPDCGVKLRYERFVDGSARMDYFSYSLPTGFGMRVLFETDGEGASVSRQLPEGVLRCSDAPLGPDLADRINNAEDQLFIISTLPEGGYRVEPVVMAAVLEEMGDEIIYRSPFAEFTFDTENAVIGVNLDSANDGATVTFEGLEGTGCTSSYLLRQYNAAAAFPYIIFRVVPGLGIVERRLTGDGRANADETIRAVSANEEELSAYLRGRCETQEREAAFVPLYIEPQAAELPPDADQRPASPSAKVATYDGPARPAPVTLHQVTKGETLYSIARRYGTSVAEIQRTNNLAGNAIFVGQELSISGDEFTAPAEEPPPVRPAPADPIVTIPPAAPAPAPDPLPTIPAPAPTTEDRYHIVRPGETFASLALRFGYTTQRFKEFNDLKDASVAYVGQRLLTTDCTCPTEEPPVRDPESVSAPEPTPYGTVNDYESAYIQTPAPVVPPTPNVVAPPPPVTPDRYGSAPSDPTYSSPPPKAFGGPVEAERAIHIVQEGQSLYGIARQYRVTVQELLELNELQPADVIVPYQKLYVN